MGRKPTRNLNLPKGMRARHRPAGTYYYFEGVDRKEIPLGNDYAEAVRKWSELAISKIPAHASITFRHIGDRYMRDILPAKAKGTQAVNLREMAQLYKYFDDAPVNEIEPINIRQYLDWRKDAPVRANREKALFSHVWNFARSTGMTNKANPCAGIKGFKESGRDAYIEDVIYKAVWNAGDQPLRDALDLAYLTGQRPADVLKATQSDISDGALTIVQNKTSKRLRISIEGELSALLDRIGQRKVRGLRLIHCDGKAMTYSMLRRLFDQARDAAVLKNPEMELAIRAFQFRDLRAKAGTDTEQSSGMAAAKDQLGHSTETMTAQYVRHRKGKLVKPTK